MAAQSFDCGEQFSQRTPKPIEADHGERVTLAGIGDQFGQSRPLHAFSRYYIGEHLDGAGILQSHGLARHILIAGADAGVAQNAAHLSCLPNGRSVDALKGDRFTPPIAVHILCLFTHGCP